MYLNLHSYFHSYPLAFDESTEGLMDESGSQRDIAAELMIGLEKFPKANAWFKATRNVVLDADGKEAVLRNTLARAIEGRAEKGQREPRRGRRWIAS